MEILVLGPVRARRDRADGSDGSDRPDGSDGPDGPDGPEVALNGPRERGVLAALALAGPAGIDTARLVDQVWGERAPRTAERTVQAYLSRLRASLGGDVVVTRAGRHRLANATVDLWRFRDLYEHARSSPVEARAALQEALALWRDPVPACDATLDGADIDLAALGQARLAAADLLVGYLDDASAIEAAERILAEDPHREAVWHRLATALYRLGRPAEALQAVRRARRHLVGDLGLDPSPPLVELEHDLLTHRVQGPGAGTAPPAPLTPLVGRGELLAQVSARLRTHRLVTLLGTGGIGKSRLAIAAAQAAPRTAPFAALAGATTRQAVEDTLLAAVGADRDRDDATTACIERLGRGSALVVVDNCEHVVPVVASFLTELLKGCPGVTVLATSRTPLGVPGEALVEVPPLQVESDALALFTARAAEVTDTEAWTVTDRAHALAICRELDGLPLALELTARRLRHAPLATVRRELSSVEVSAAAAEPRHRSLSAALDPSYSALDDAVQEAFRRLALLHGPVPVETAANVAGGSGLVAALADMSLVVSSPEGVRMYEPLRQYAAARTTAGERRTTQTVIASEVIALAERGRPFIAGPDELHWQGILDGVHADVRGVLEWAAACGRQEILARLAAAVGHMWLLGWGVREGHVWLDAAVSGCRDDQVKPRLFYLASVTALRRGDLERARTFADDGIRISRERGDREALGPLLHARAQPDKYAHGVELARSLLQEAVNLRRECGDLAGAAMSIGALADLELNLGNFDLAAEGYAVGLPLMRRSESPRGLLAYLHSMSELELLRGSPEAATVLVAEARLLAERTQDPWHRALLALVGLSAARDLHAPAEQLGALARAALDACAAQTDPTVILDCVDEAAGALLDAGSTAAALRLLRGSRQVRDAGGVPVAVPRKARRDADETRAAGAAALPDTGMPVDIEWLLATATDALR